MFNARITKSSTFADVTISDARADALIAVGSVSVRLVGVDHQLISEFNFLFS